MYRRTTALRERTSARYKRIEVGECSWVFRRLTPSEAALQLQEVQDVLNEALDVFSAHSEVAKALQAGDTSEETQQAWRDAHKAYATALGCRQAAVGYTIALMWADPVWSLDGTVYVEDGEPIRDDLRGAIKKANDPIIDIGAYVYEELFDELGHHALIEQLYTQVLKHQNPRPTEAEDPGPSAAARESHFSEAQAEATT